MKNKGRDKYNKGSRPVFFGDLGLEVEQAIAEVPTLENRTFSDAVRILVRKGLEAVYGSKKRS